MLLYVYYAAVNESNIHVSTVEFALVKIVLKNYMGE